MNHHHAADDRYLILGLGSWAFGQLADFPLAPALMLAVAMFTPLARRFGEWLAERLFGPAKPGAPK
jgi:hypothetical protein